MTTQASDFRFGEHRRVEATPTAAGRRRATTTTRDVTRWLSRQTAGTLALVLAMFAGTAIGQQTWIETAETPAGTAIVIGQPGASFWATVGLFGAAVVLLMYATRGQP